jgi:glycosyltransferase involved in cell wall biosynthesis
MKLSIIIPTFTRKISSCSTESIKRQDFDDYEVIVADAGSQDRTREIAQEWGCKVVDGGMPAVGRNHGTEKARGDYLLFFGFRCNSHQDYLESCVYEFQKGNWNSYHPDHTA